MANLSKTTLNAVALGDCVKFTVKDYNDNVEYSGIVVAICDYETARSYEDVVARHQAMMSVSASANMNEDISAFRFIIVECYDGIRRPFAFDPVTGESWFTNNEIEVIDPTEEFIIGLKGCNRTQANIALRILKEHGYSCYLSTDKK